MNYANRRKAVEAIVRRLLRLIGEDANREGLLDTPARVARALLKELCRGVQVSEKKLIKMVKVFRDPLVSGQLIAVKDIAFSSLCEHHLLPFVGTAHVVYIPNGKGMISGLSKVARVLDVLAARPQVQERLTAQLFSVLEKAVQPTALLVSLSASHECMRCRGVKKTESSTATMKYDGLFKTDPFLRRDAIELLR